MKQNKKIACLALLLALVLGVSGCAITSPSVEDLLRAPILSGDYSALQSALIASYDSTVQLKYPTEGELLSPFSFGDCDGDGVQEAVVLFTHDDFTNVQVALLKQDDSGTWQVIGVADGLSDTVVTVAFATMQAGDAQQIVVGFQAQGGQYLAVYAYQDAALTAVLQQPYSQYLVEDITGTGTEDLILMSSNEAGEAQMELLTFGTDGFTQTLVPSFNDEPFTSYQNITVSEVRTGRQYLVIDGFVGEGQATLVTEMIWYNSATGEFQQPILANTNDLYNASKRYSASLISMDIDGDGRVDVPVVYTETGMVNQIQSSPISLIVWMDYASYSSKTSFGLFDDEYDYYLALPNEMKGDLLLVDGEEEGTIEVRDLSGEGLYFTLRVVDFDKNDSGWYQIGIVASKQIQIKMGEGVSTFVSAYALSQSIYLL